MLSTSLETTIADYNQNFTTWWNRVFTEYKEQQGRVWFAGPTSYVISLAEQRFAVDLQIRRQEDLDKVKTHLIKDTSELSFILITHQHDDHMCVPLMQSLADTNIKWYIPYGTRSDLIEKSRIKKENIIWVNPGGVWNVGKIQFRAFETPHTKPGEKLFLQCGYEISTANGKILIPGDVRDYDYKGYPEFENIDLCLAHLWAGNDALNRQKYMPILKEFVAFHAQLNAKKYFLCHLYEIGRSSQYMWDEEHAEIAIKMFASLLPGSQVTVPHLGDSYSLNFREEK